MWVWMLGLVWFGNTCSKMSINVKENVVSDLHRPPKAITGPCPHPVLAAAACVRALEEWNIEGQPSLFTTNLSRVSLE